VCDTNTHHEYDSGNSYTNRDCRLHKIIIKRDYLDPDNNGMNDVETHTASFPHLNKDNGDKKLNNKVSSLTKLKGASVSIHQDHDYDGKCIDLTQQTSLNFKDKKWNDKITSIGIPNKCDTSDWWDWGTGGGRL